MTSDDFGSLTSRLSGQLDDFEDARRELLSVWQDAAGAKASRLLAELGERASAASQCVISQADAHDRAEACCRLVADHSRAADQLVGESHSALDEASSALREAQAGASEAVAVVRASAENLEEALRLLGRSGGVSSGEWEGRVQQQLATVRRRAVWGMAAKAVAVEGAWTLGEQIVQQVGRIPEGALPANWTDRVRESLEADVPVASAQISGFIQALTRKWSGR